MQVRLFCSTVMATATLFGVNPFTLLLCLLSSFVIVHILIYAFDVHRIRSHPGPFLAKFSDLWLGWVSYHGHRSEVVHEMHKKYGQ